MLDAALMVAAIFGEIHASRGEWDEASAGLRLSLEDFERLGDRVGAAGVLRSEGDLALRRDRLSDAFACYEAAVANLGELAGPLDLARLLARKALVHKLLGDPAAEVFRQEYETILAETDLDERCLRLPPAQIQGNRWES